MDSVMVDDGGVRNVGGVEVFSKGVGEDSGDCVDDQGANESEQVMVGAPDKGGELRLVPVQLVGI